VHDAIATTRGGSGHGRRLTVFEKMPTPQALSETKTTCEQHEFGDQLN